MKEQFRDPDMKYFGDICKYLSCEADLFPGSPMIGERIGFLGANYKKCRVSISTPVGRGLNFTCLEIQGEIPQVKEVYKELRKLIL